MSMHVVQAVSAVPEVSRFEYWKIKDIFNLLSSRKQKLWIPDLLPDLA